MAALKHSGCTGPEAGIKEGFYMKIQRYQWANDSKLKFNFLNGTFNKGGLNLS